MNKWESELLSKKRERNVKQGNIQNNEERHFSINSKNIPLKYPESDNFSQINTSQLMKYKYLNFEIDSWSSYISTFHPKNILLDNKHSGPLSKWSVHFKSQNEFLFLKLEKTSIIYMITFGKFKDPTNLKEFKVFAGMDKINLTEILHVGLTMDNEYEAFTVKYQIDNTFIPCKYD